MLAGHAPRHAQQPFVEAEGAIAGKLVDGAEDREEDLLAEVLRFRRAAEPLVEEPVDARVIRVEEHAERVTVARLGAPDDFVVVHRSILAAATVPGATVASG